MTRNRMQRLAFLAVLVAAGVPFLARANDAPPAAAKPAATEAKTTPGAVQSKPPGGWRVVMKDTTVYWCIKQTQFGSRMRTEERCLTPDQYESLQRSSQQLVDDLRRAAPPPKGD